MQLVMPMNYEYIEQKEMMYLDGGWSRYTGSGGWVQVSKMLSDIAGFVTTSAKLMKAAAGFAATGIGIALTILSIVGAGTAWTAAIWNASVVTTAIFYMVRDRGFRQKDVGLFSLSINMIKPL